MVDRNLDMSASKILGCAEDWMKLRRRERRQVLSLNPPMDMDFVSCGGDEDAL
jgi:hypothetical protein